MLEKWAILKNAKIDNYLPNVSEKVILRNLDYTNRLSDGDPEINFKQDEKIGVLSLQKVRYLQKSSFFDNN